MSENPVRELLRSLQEQSKCQTLVIDKVQLLMSFVENLKQQINLLETLTAALKEENIKLKELNTVKK